MVYVRHTCLVSFGDTYIHFTTEGSLRDVPRGVARERIENDTAHDIVSYAYATYFFRRCEISAYYCSTYTSRHLQLKTLLLEMHLHSFRTKHAWK